MWLLKSRANTVCLLGVLAVLPFCHSWGYGDQKVKLKDIDTLTLRAGSWTTGRRSAPVPQLQCVGGTAGCSSFVPQVVQCYNRGSDGFDVQWECKTDMDNAFRFGKVDVTCEGYDYPDDPYVLKGSCGLEYTIDLTKEGYSHNSQSQHSYYQSDGGYSGYNTYSNYGWSIPKKQSNFATNLACFVVVCIIVYAIYKTCIVPYSNQQAYSRTSQDYPGGGGGGQRPPPPGFNPSFYSSGPDYQDSCSGGTRNPGPSTGGFWTGAATGGLLGYLFGSRNRGYNDPGYYTNSSYSRPRPSTSWGSSGGWGSSGYSSSGGSSSTGTRTASGFGGTRRR